jgi:glycosyltransferase involved in cell wall biosynthesis
MADSNFQAKVIDCSIVIPAHNASSTILRCIESVFSQGLSQLEVIVIDDGSQDETAQVIGDLLAKDPRVRLVKQAQQGPSAARNRGLSEARGKYLLFLDADDWLEPRGLERMVNLLESTHVEAVRGYFKYVFEDGSTRSPNIGIKTGLFQGKNQVQTIVSAILKGQIQGFSPLWVFRRDSICDLRFPTHLNFMEDVVFLANAISKLERVFISDLLVLNYFQSTKSLTRSAENFINNFKDGLSVINLLSEVAQDLTPDLESANISAIRIEQLGRMLPLAFRDKALSYREYLTAVEYIQENSILAEFLSQVPLRNKILGATSLFVLIQRGRPDLAWFLTRVMGNFWRFISTVRNPKQQRRSKG